MGGVRRMCREEVGGIKRCWESQGPEVVCMVMSRS